MSLTLRRKDSQEKSKVIPRESTERRPSRTLIFTSRGSYRIRGWNHAGDTSESRIRIYRRIGREKLRHDEERCSRSLTFHATRVSPSRITAASFASRSRNRHACSSDYIVNLTCAASHVVITPTCHCRLVTLNLSDVSDIWEN